MNTFFENWKQCMHGNGLPVPCVEDANEALEFVHKLHLALENAGGDEEMTIGTLITFGAAGIDEAALAVLGEVAQVAAAFYIDACISCIVSVALDDLKRLFANNELPNFVVAELDSQGIDLTGEVIT